MGTATKNLTGAGHPDEAFEALYERYRRLVRSVLFKIALRDDVDDLVQETFLKVWRHRSQLREAASEKAWVVRVAVNVARDCGRKNLRSPSFAVLDEKKARAVESRPEEQQALLAGLAELSPSHREVLVLHCLEGLTMEEIAESLELAVGTVKSRLHYAKASLHEYLERKGSLK